MKLYGVVIMDIKGSRDIKDRPYIQRKMQTHMDILNQKYKKILPVPIKFTLGDEWQLLTEAPYECYNFIEEFQQLLWADNIKLYAGIGLGYLSTEISSDIGAMDGSCFIMARQAIDIAKRNTGRKQIHSKDCRVYLCYIQEISEYINNDNAKIYNVDEVAIDSKENTPIYKPDTKAMINNLINTLIENNEILKEKITEKQRSAYTLYEKMGTYRKVSEVNQDSIGGISAKLNTANYFVINHNNETIKAMLYYYCRLGEVIK